MRCSFCGEEFEALRINEATGIVACEGCHEEIDIAAEADDDDEQLGEDNELEELDEQE